MPGEPCQALLGAGFGFGEGGLARACSPARDAASNLAVRLSVARITSVYSSTISKRANSVGRSIDFACTLWKLGEHNHSEDRTDTAVNVPRPPTC